ncbi:hypothetical protein D5S17_34355 [Pseudonocardiaceae bacterium YIM PH 21723]|nr:hypothetical protein D5S17_34355 [Pseudonocardiaceae bacterium YIM PH 21723]
MVRKTLALLGIAAMGLLASSVAASAATTAEKTGQYVVITSQANPQHALDVLGAEVKAGARVVTNQIAATETQKWQIEYRGNGAIALVNKARSVVGQAGQLCLSAPNPFEGQLVLNTCSRYDLSQNFLPSDLSEYQTILRSAQFSQRVIDLGAEPNSPVQLEKLTFAPSQILNLHMVQPATREG